MTNEIKPKKTLIKTEFTTKEVATQLGLSTKTLLNLRNHYEKELDGLVIVSSEETIKGRRQGYLWTPKASNLRTQHRK